MNVTVSDYIVTRYFEGKQTKEETLKKIIKRHISVQIAKQEAKS